MDTLKWKRDGRGRQISTCGRYAVRSDGYSFVSQADRDSSGVAAGITGGEWASIDLSRPDENMDWFPTMREAKAHCQRHANR